jgi:hypothetical protein
MTLVESFNNLSAPHAGELDAVVEGMLGEHLRQECERYTRACAEHGLPDVEVATEVLDEFMDWCEDNGLPSSASALAYYLLGLHRCGADVADLYNIARAFLIRSDWDLRLPIIAALACCEATPRAIATRMLN